MAPTEADLEKARRLDTLAPTQKKKKRKAPSVKSDSDEDAAAETDDSAVR